MVHRRFPSRSQLVLPLLQSLYEAGGQATPANLYDQVARKINLPQSLRELRAPAGKAGEINLWERQLRNARQNATSAGLIENDLHKRKRNVWELTDKGRQGLRN